MIRLFPHGYVIVRPSKNPIKILRRPVKMKKFVSKWGHVLAAFALVVTALTSNVACGWVYHQPKMPEAAKKLRKF